MSRQDLRTLIIEDDDDYAAFLAAVANQDNMIRLVVTRVKSLAEAIELEDDFDVAVLDLGLPDGSGLAAVSRLLEHVSCPVVVLTALDDPRTAVDAMRLGVQEYLLKEETQAPLLLRAVRYAVERDRLTRQVTEAKHASERERELRRLERLTASSTSLTAGSFGGGPLRDRSPAHFSDFASEYGRIMDQAIEERAYRRVVRTREDLQSLAALLGHDMATPRDLVDLHTAALKDALKRADPGRQQALVEEGRLLALELMGNLATHYRTRSTRLQPDTSTRESA